MLRHASTAVHLCSEMDEGEQKNADISVLLGVKDRAWVIVFPADIALHVQLPHPVVRGSWLKGRFGSSMRLQWVGSPCVRFICGMLE
jgi:hypothetical protein